ncbi:MULTISPECIES: hypothetical protein [unclassified Chelatococcus]|uniref:hypothetical protein n=1 Tax=unclassified Chelatococcus TaxID=2638111 RepID=UPI001BCCDDAF|nr:MULTISPECIES: hypothetical protein [unclassified Chelatococcus]MBS7695987.1 hypothetical protein [Chelatococcus sp. YT9]MBX3555638.1 hypothetical protein [Chelatococcus sp.]
MSDTKWRLALGAVYACGVQIQEMKVKFVDVPEVKRLGSLWFKTPHAFTDSLEYGPFPLVAIEGLEFPRDIDQGRRSNPHCRGKQDIAAIRAALDATGKALPLEDTETGLRIVGHRFSR